MSTEAMQMRMSRLRLKGLAEVDGHRPADPARLDALAAGRRSVRGRPCPRVSELICYQGLKEQGDIS